MMKFKTVVLCLKLLTCLIVERSFGNFHYVAMLMTTSHKSKSVDFTETQKSRYLENKALFFLQIEKFINYLSKAKNNDKE